MKKNMKSKLTNAQIFSNFQLEICNIHTIKRLTNNNWKDTEFFIGDKKSHTSFWFSKHAVANKSSSIDMPLCMSSIKIVVELDEKSDGTIIKYFFKHTATGYFLAILSCLCLIIFLNVFYSFLAFFHPIHGILALFLLFLGVICGIGFYNLNDRVILLKQLLKITEIEHDSNTGDGSLC